MILPRNENELIKLLTGKWRYSPKVVCGVGDDCAVIAGASPGRYILLKTDAIVEGRHFTAEAAPAKIGHKAIARVISDFAAMGGIPQFAVVTLFIPPSFNLKRLTAIYAGMDKTARAYGMNLVGGETTRATDFALNIAAIGEADKRHLTLRSTAKTGDLVFVTGSLGGSIKGKHLSFTPRLNEAKWLVRHFKPTAMMDLSDGLGEDLPRLASASGLSYQIDPGNIPRQRGVSLDEALSDGEDYELLFTLPPSKSQNLQKAWKDIYQKLRLTCIGKMGSNKQSSTTLSHGFDHLRYK